MTRRGNPPTAKTEAEATQLNNNPSAAQIEADVASSLRTDKHHNLLAAETKASTNACEQRSTVGDLGREPQATPSAGAAGRQQTQRSTGDGPRPWAVMPSQPLAGVILDGGGPGVYPRDPSTSSVGTVPQLRPRIPVGRPRTRQFTGDGD